jgi:hypothetical protein
LTSFGHDDRFDAVGAGGLAAPRGLGLVDADLFGVDDERAFGSFLVDPAVRGGALAVGDVEYGVSADVYSVAANQGSGQRGVYCGELAQLDKADSVPQVCRASRRRIRRTRRR